MMDRVLGSSWLFCCSSDRVWTSESSLGSRRIQLQQAHFSGAEQEAVTGLNQEFPGMKVLESVEGDLTTLLYKPYLDYLCLALAPGLQNLPLADELAFQSSSKSAQKANVYNWLYRTQRLRRIRVTYFDAGRACQAFNALLYPDTRFDLPLLGIDLLSFGSSKILCVVDFIPISRDPSYLEKYIVPLGDLRQPFAEHCTQMSDRFFDKDMFASDQMIFFRSSLGASAPELQVPNGGMYKVYVQYVSSYLQALHSLNPVEDQSFCSGVEDQQRAYDKYLADRDPAFKVFSSYFGKEWTHKFCSDFLCPGLAPSKQR